MKRPTHSRRGDLTERQTLIPLLLLERPYSRRELADRFRVSAKTITRALEMLELHHPIDRQRQGREVVYRLLSDRQYKTPNFTPAELATLLLAQQSIAATGAANFGTPFAGYGQTLLQKVRAALPASLRAKLDALSTIFGTVALRSLSVPACTGVNRDSLMLLANSSARRSGGARWYLAPLQQLSQTGQDTILPHHQRAN